MLKSHLCTLWSDYPNKSIYPMNTHSDSKEKEGLEAQIAYITAGL